MRPTTINIRLPFDWHAALERHAADTGISAAEIIRRGIKRELPKALRDTLSEPRKHGRPPKEQP